MTYLIDFLNHDRIQNSHIFPYLDCNPHEAEILKKILISMLNNSLNDVVSFCESQFNALGVAIIPYLKEFYNLSKKGFIAPIRNIEMRLEMLSPVMVNSDSDGYLSALNYNLELNEIFLQILEKEIYPKNTLKVKEYKNITEYINDYMKLLNIIIKSNNSALFINNEKLKELFLLECEDLKENIESNLALNNKSKNIFYINKLFEKYNFNALTRNVFIVLVYNQINGNTTQVRNLIPLGQDELERIEIQKLMSDDSVLLKNDLIYFSDFFSKQAYIDRGICLTNKIFNKIMHTDYELNMENELEDSDIFDYVNPDVDFNNVILDDEIKNRLEIIIKHANPAIHVKLKQWGIKKDNEIDSKILLYGDSGTGKTMSAYAVAKSLDKKILSLDCSKILSMYVGESEKNVRRIFDEYREFESVSTYKPILLLDEADQLLSTRGNSFNGTARMYNQMQNIFLSQIEKFNGIIIATTNLLENLDSAFSRRFHYKIKFSRPSFEQRIRIWDMHLPLELEIDNRRDLLHKLAKFDLSGGQIKIVVLNVAYKVALRDSTVFDYIDFKDEIEKEINGDFGTNKKLGFQI